jgi:hypothetical protein
MTDEMRILVSTLEWLLTEERAAAWQGDEAGQVWYRGWWYCLILKSDRYQLPDRLWCRSLAWEQAERYQRLTKGTPLIRAEFEAVYREALRKRVVAQPV